MSRHPPEWFCCLIGLMLALAVALPAVQAAREHGVVRGMVALGIGCAALVGGALALMAVAYAAELARRAGPRFPPCHSGTCRGRWWPSLDEKDLGDYTRAMVGGESVLRCKCGLEYVTRDAERRILRRLPDGTLEPYMVHRDYRGWVPDRGMDD